jgi:hypothetical protein
LLLNLLNLYLKLLLQRRGGKKLIVKIQIQIHQSISLTMMIKEIVVMMMTQNLMSC